MINTPFFKMVRHNYYNSPPPYTAPRGEYANYYRRSQFGAGQLPAFSGTRRQRGHGLFGNLIKTALPMIKNLGMSAVRAVAPTLFNTGKGVLSDVLAGKNLKSSVIKRSKQAGTEVIGKAARYLSGGSGRPKAKRRQTPQGGRRAKRKKTTLF